VNRLQRSVTRRLNEWRNDQWSTTLESPDPEDQSLWRMTKRVMTVPIPSPLHVNPGEFALSDSEKAEALADNLETQFQPVTDPTVQAVIENVGVGLRSYVMAPASEPKLTNSEEVQEAIMGLKVTPGGFARSDSKKAEALVDKLETQFQPVTDPSVPAVIESVCEGLRSYVMAPASERKLTNTEEVQEAIMSLKVSKAPGPKGIPNRDLKHLPQREVSIRVLIFNAILLTHHFPIAWKHARVISILKPGKDPALPLSYRPISFMDTIGKLFENILLARILHEVNVR
jgi:archaellum component FlaG (FlaF/FlaG flagellin family)